MALLDLLGRRWALRIGWELSREPCSFGALQARCDGMSPSVLSQRLREASDAGILERDDEGVYRLTKEGKRLYRLLLPLDGWASDWAARARGR